MQQPSAPTLQELRDNAAKQRLEERVKKEATRRPTPTPSLAGDPPDGDARSQLSVLSRRSSAFGTTRSEHSFATGTAHEHISVVDPNVEHYHNVDGVYRRKDGNIKEYLPGTDATTDAQAKLQKLADDNFLNF